MSLFKPGHLPSEEKQITEHDCEQVVLQTYEVREDLRETALESPDPILWDGSSFMKMRCIRLGTLWSPSPRLWRVLPFFPAPVFS